MMLGGWHLYRSGTHTHCQVTGHVMRPRGRRLIIWVISAIAFQAFGTLVALYWWQGVPAAREWEEPEHQSQRHEVSTATSSQPLSEGSTFPDYGLPVGENISYIPSRYRTLWTAGWNARFPMYFRDAPPVVTWDSRTETVFESEWLRLQFPDACDSVKGWFVIDPLTWGLTSIARDYLSSLLRAMAQNHTLVYKEGFRFCPPEFAGRYIDCFWQDLGSCQSVWRSVGRATHHLIEQPWQEAVKPVRYDEFPHWLWARMRDSGGLVMRDPTSGAVVEEASLDPSLGLQLKLSVLRAIMARVVLRPRGHIMTAAQALVRQWAEKGASSEAPRGLVIHLRRTDKAKDDGPHWRHIDTSSSNHIGPLIRRMEEAVGRPFPHYLVLSDDTRLHKKAARELARFFSSPHAVPLSSDLLCHYLGADRDTFNQRGHEARDDKSRAELYSMLLAEVYAAIYVSDYIIGSGSCGVSQFIAHNLGAKHCVEPGLLALWEDDIVVEECREWMDDVLDYHKRCDEWTKAEVAVWAEAKSRADASLKKWREQECSVFVPLPDFAVCLRT